MDMDARSAILRGGWSWLAFRPQFSLRSLLLAVLAVGIGLGACQLANVRLPYLYTGRDLDIAIHGRGYFQLLQGESQQLICYSRDGRFWVDESYLIRCGAPEHDLYLYPLVSIPCDSQAGFDPDGGVYAYERRASYLTAVGSLQLSQFANPDGLEEVLPGIYRQTDSSGVPIHSTPGEQGLGTCLPGWIELGDPQRKCSALAVSPPVIVAFMLGAMVGVLVPRLARHRRPTPPLPAPAGGA